MTSMRKRASPSVPASVLSKLRRCIVFFLQKGSVMRYFSQKRRGIIQKGPRQFVRRALAPFRRECPLAKRDTIERREPWNDGVFVTGGSDQSNHGPPLSTDARYDGLAAA